MSNLETLKSEIAALSGEPLAKAIGAGSGDAPADLLKSHIESYTRKDGSVVQAHDDKRVKKTAIPPIHAHTDKIRAMAEERKGNKTDDHEQMNAVADHLDKGDHEAAASTLKHMDTEPRDAVLDHVHPEHREKLGFTNIDKEKNIAKFEKDHPAPEKKVVLKKKPKNDPEAVRAAGAAVRAGMDKNAAEKKAAGQPEGFQPRKDVAGPTKHADANEKDWDSLPDEENPKHALSGFSSKGLGKVARGESDLNDHAAKELANRGVDSDGNWVGFDKAAEHHKEAISRIAQHKDPKAFSDPDGDRLSMTHTKILSAAAKGHLDLNKRAKVTLANRGHDSNGDWVGFKEAEKHHFGDKKSEKKDDLAKNLTGADLLKAHINGYTKTNGTVVAAHERGTDAHSKAISHLEKGKALTEKAIAHWRKEHGGAAMPLSHPLAQLHKHHTDAIANEIVHPKD